ncbi:MAG: DUF2970 domain-containing protein [Halieaceae bacterium]
MTEQEKEQQPLSADQGADEPRLNPVQIVGSVLAAAFGVQSSKNRERDFKEGKFINFIVAGVVFTALFVGAVYMVVSTVLENAR